MPSVVFVEQLDATTHIISISTLSKAELTNAALLGVDDIPSSRRGIPKWRLNGTDELLCQGKHNPPSWNDIQALLQLVLCFPSQSGQWWCH
jgi:hypothetical protein